MEALSAVTRADLDVLARLVRREIPITQYLDFTFVAFDESGLLMQAPLKPNVNHRGTAFGGSLSMLATLAGWSLVHLLLRDAANPLEVVIQKSMVQFDAPVPDDFEIVCPIPDAEARSRFWQMLHRRDKGRITVRGHIIHEQVTLARFEGTYVALRE